jgi:hypothetical protein
MLSTFSPGNSLLDSGKVALEKSKFDTFFGEPVLL